MKDETVITIFVCSTIMLVVSGVGFLFYQFGGEPDVAGVRMCVDLKADAATCDKFLSYRGFSKVDETKTITTRTVTP